MTQRKRGIDRMVPPPTTDGYVLTVDPTAPDDVAWKAAAGGAASLTCVRATRTGGNLTLNSHNAWANVDTGLDLVIAAADGDVLLVGADGMIEPGGSGHTTRFDMFTWVSGAAVNQVGGGGNIGNPGWFCLAAHNATITGAIPYVVVSGDISSGEVTLRFRYLTDEATNRTLNADSDPPLKVWVVNLG